MSYKLTRAQIERKSSIGSGRLYKELHAKLDRGGKYSPLELLDKLSISDTLSCLRALKITPKELHALQFFLLDYSKNLLPIYKERYPTDNRIEEAWFMRRSFLAGRASMEAMSHAANKARNAILNDDRSIISSAIYYVCTADTLREVHIAGFGVQEAYKEFPWEKALLKQYLNQWRSIDES